MVNIELKSVKLIKSMSQETPCYTAKLYADGKFVANISNDGHGGADRVETMAPGLTYHDIRSLEQRIRTEHPKQDLLGDGKLFEQTLEGLCHQLVGEFEIARDVARLVKTNIVFFEKGLPAESTNAPLLMIKFNSKNGDAAAAALAYVKSRYPKAYILNEQSEIGVIEAYKRAI